MKNILAIGAHPDDLEFGCFGTLKRHIEKGDNVILAVMTYSTVTDSNGNETRKEELSKREALQSAKLLGAKVYFLGFQDTEVPFNKYSIDAIEKLITKHNIDTIYTHWAGDTHQDHINTLNSTLAAGRLVNNVFCYEQVPLPRVCTEYPVANYYVDITKYINFKVKACECHTSQIKKFNTQGLNIIDGVYTLAMYRGNQTNVKYAEAFTLLKYLDYD